MSERTKTERLRDIIIGSSMSSEDKVKAVDIVVALERSHDAVKQSITSLGRDMMRHRNDEFRAVGKALVRGMEES